MIINFQKYCWFIIVVSTLFLPAVAQAYTSECLPIAPKMQGLNLLPYLYQHDDLSSQLKTPWLRPAITFEKVESEKGAKTYTFNTQRHARWIRYCLHNTTQKTQDVVVALGPAVLLEVDYYPQHSGDKSVLTGSARPYANRQIDNPEFHFSVHLDPGQRKEYYVRIRPQLITYLKAHAWDLESYSNWQYEEHLEFGLFFGIFLSLVLYNILMLMAQPKASAFWFICALAALFSVHACFDGRMAQYIFPNRPELVNEAIIWSHYLSCLFAALLARSFLELKQFPKIDKGAVVLLFLFSAICFVSYFIDKEKILILSVCTYLFWVIYFLIFATGYGLYKGASSAKYFLFTFTPIGITLIDAGLINLGLISENFFFFDTRVGASVTMILIAYCIGRSIQKDKDRAQKDAYDQLKISEKLKNDYNIALKRDIEISTKEIRTMNKKLADMNNHLETQANQLMNLDKIKSNFFASISHEFRTPLTLMIGAHHDLLDQRHGTLSEETRQAITLANTQSQHLLELVEELLDITRLEEGVLRLCGQRVNFSTFVDLAVTQFESLANAKSILLECHIPSTAADIIIDSQQMHKVINNLMSNALKFTPKNGTVKVELEIACEHYYLHVNDTGPGIAEKEHTNIFKRFYQVANTTGALQGVGLGLPLAKEIAELHQGSLTVASLPGQGSCFTLTLPRATHLIATEQNPVSPTHSTALAEKTHKKAPCEPSINTNTTILIVEDHDCLRQYIAEHLKDHYRILEATDGKQGYEQACQETPDIIISDVMMPNMSGIELCKALKSNPETDFIPIILLTALAEEPHQIEGFNAEADDYMGKPFSADVLKSRVKNLILSRRNLLAKSHGSGPLFPQPEGLINREQQFSSKLENVIRQNLSNSQFNVDTLAQEMGMERTTLFRKVRSTFDRSPKELITQAKLDWACRLLEEPEGSISDIAFTVGYSSVAHFSHSFKKALHSTPSAFRKLHWESAAQSHTPTLATAEPLG